MNLTFLVLVFLIVLGLPVSASEPLFVLANQEREEKLEWSSCLSEKAEERAKFLVTHNYWAHYTEDGTTPWMFIKDCGYRIAGENLARDFSTKEEMHQAFMNSEGHRKNIINTKFTEMGTGCFENICVEYFTGH